MQNAIDILRERGFLYQLTDEEASRKLLGEGPQTFYVGFDPTADSLHVGHLLPIMGMRWLQKCGHRPIALVGGGTGMIGDPTGRTAARKVLTVEDVDHNCSAIHQQLSHFLDFSDGKALLLNNADWLRNLHLIDFLRQVGSLFSVPHMLAQESVKSRLENGITFLEFTYPLLQGFDFYTLFKDYNCRFQFGGQDQWGNITAGTEMTRRLAQGEVYGVTFPLFLKSDGTKFGKSAGGAVWLDPKKTTPFQYYQFWRNVDDADVQKILGYFTALPMDKVRALGSLQPPMLNRAKEILAYEATALAHDHDTAMQAFVAAGSEFGFADPDHTIPTSSRIAETPVIDLSASLPTTEVTQDELDAGLPVFALLVKATLCKSSSDARRLIQGGGCQLNDTKVTDVKRIIAADDFGTDGAFVLKAGKKSRRRIVLVQKNA